MNNKTAKKVGERFTKFTKWDFVRLRGIIKRVGVAGVMFAAVFVAVWLAMPVNGARAAFRKQKSRVSAGFLVDLSVMLRIRLIIYYQYSNIKKYVKREIVNILLQKFLSEIKFMQKIIFKKFLKKIALAGFIFVAMTIGFLWNVNGAEAAFNNKL